MNDVITSNIVNIEILNLKTTYSTLEVWWVAK